MLDKCDDPECPCNMHKGCGFWLGRLISMIPAVAVTLVGAVNLSLGLTLTGLSLLVLTAEVIALREKVDNSCWY